jgi:hypothetical protein
LGWSRTENMTCIESLAQICRIRAGRACPLSPGISNLNLFRDSKRMGFDVQGSVRAGHRRHPSDIDSASPDPRLAAANWPAYLSLWRPLMGVFGSPKITASSSQESLATRYLPNRAVAQDHGLQECEGVYQANIKCQCSFRHQASMDSRHKILFGVR